MVDVQTISIAIASASVVVGVIYYAFQIRQQTKVRQIDFIMRMGSTFISKELLQSFATLNKTEFKNYDDFEKKSYLEARQVASFCENLGVLVKRKLVDISLVADIYAIGEMWERLKLWIEESRRRANNPKLYEWFEYLYNEMKKREQQLAKAQ
jgi:cytochrome c oxidase assembly factor CtaG